MSSSFISDIKLPKVLDLPKNATFGVEIEFENAKLTDVEEKLKKAKDNNLLDINWKLKQDDSLHGINASKGFGGEVVSPVLKDQIEAYKQIRNACHIIESCDGIATSKCGGHIHIGSNLLEGDVKNYSRLARLWTVFENEIIRFGLGEDDIPRDSMAFYASSSARLLCHIELLESEKYGPYTFENFIRCFALEKKLAMSFFYLNPDKPFHTIEMRSPNGTINPIIWKNNINFFVKLLASCTDEKKDWNMIYRLFDEEKKIEYNDYFDEIESLDKAKMLAKFIFNNERDIDNFMLQYKKDSNKILVLSR